MRGDLAHPRIDREGDLDHLVEGRFISGRTQRAIVLLVIEGLQRGAGIEHAAAPRAQHVPGQIEQADPRCMQERRDRLLDVDIRCRRKAQRVDAAEIAIRSVPDQALDGIDGTAVGGLPQDVE